MCRYPKKGLAGTEALSRILPSNISPSSCRQLWAHTPVSFSLNILSAAAQPSLTPPALTSTALWKPHVFPFRFPPPPLVNVLRIDKIGSDPSRNTARATFFQCITRTEETSLCGRQTHLPKNICQIPGRLCRKGEYDPAD